MQQDLMQPVPRIRLGSSNDLFVPEAERSPYGIEREVEIPLRVFQGLSLHGLDRCDERGNMLQDSRGAIRTRRPEGVHRVQQSVPLLQIRCHSRAPFVRALLATASPARAIPGATA